MTKIKWQEPPASKRGGSSTKWRDIIAQLQERPGDWAVVMEGVSRSNAVMLRKRFPVLETASRARADGAIEIYARYIGEASS